MEPRLCSNEHIHPVRGFDSVSQGSTEDASMVVTSMSLLQPVSSSTIRYPCTHPLVSHHSAAPPVPDISVCRRPDRVLFVLVADVEGVGARFPACHSLVMPISRTSFLEVQRELAAGVSTARNFRPRSEFSTFRFAAVQQAEREPGLKSRHGSSVEESYMRCFLVGSGELSISQIASAFRSRASLFSVVACKSKRPHPLMPMVRIGPCQNRGLKDIFASITQPPKMQCQKHIFFITLTRLTAVNGFHLKSVVAFCSY